MNRLLLLTLVLAIFLFSCQSENEHERRSSDTLFFPITALPTTWKPYLLYDLNTQTIHNQIFEGLVSIDQNTYQIIPQLAKEFTYSPDFTTYSFILRDDVYFHSNLSGSNERKLTINDVIKTFEHICLQENSPAYENVLKRIIGAEKFHNEKAKNIEGITVEDSVLTIELNNADPLFLQKLSLTSCGIISADWIQNPSSEIPSGTGPYYVDEYDDTHILLSRNEKYYLIDENNERLPYLKHIDFKIYHKKQNQLTDFINGKLDLIYELNAAEKNIIFEKHKADFNSYPPRMIYASHSLLSTSLILFNLNTPIFQKDATRRLFNFAVNRDQLYKNILHRRVNAVTTTYGLIPPLENYFNESDLQQLNRYSLNYDSERVSRNLDLIEAFKDDTLILNLGENPERIAIGKMIQQQLRKTLGIEVKLNVLSSEHLFKSLEDQSGDIYLVSLSGDFSNPLSLLNHFYGGGNQKSPSSISSVNFTGYHNWYYDQFFEKASRQSKPSQQRSTILMAENELLKDPPFIALYYDQDDYVYYGYIHGLHDNIVNSFYFRNIYIK